MKKIASMIIMFVCGFCACFGTLFLHAYATDDTKHYLIDANFEAQAGTYNISSNEIYDASPFDAEAQERMAGKSIMPLATAEAFYVFDKTYNTNSVELTSGSSIYMYLLFNSTTSHTLKITASDGVDGEVSWTISKQTIELQVEQTTETSRRRYGWMLVELPSAQNITINTLRFEYSSDEISEINTYGRVFIYAPYAAQKTSNNITFSAKQNYYNFAVKFGIYKYVNDKFKMTKMSDILQYCYIGELDYLIYPVNTYRFILRIQNVDKGETQSHTLVAGVDSFEYEFGESANYEMTISLYEDAIAITGTSKAFYIDEFVGIYLNFGLSEMQKGRTYVYDIVVSNELVSHGAVTATTTSENVASVRVEGNKLYVSANKKGSAKIAISVLGERAGQAPQTYSIEYTAVVNEQPKGVNWWLMGGTAIFLIVASIVVYTIMVRRRLLKGKYPKY